MKYRVYDSIDTADYTVDFFGKKFGVCCLEENDYPRLLWAADSLEEIEITAAAKGISAELEPEVWEPMPELGNKVPRWAPSNRRIGIGS